MTSSELPFHQREEGCRLLQIERWPFEVDGVQVGIQVMHPRSAPGFVVLRVPRFGRGLPRDASDNLVRDLARLARTRPVLRIHLEAWTEDPEQMTAIGRACRAHGFRETPPLSYAKTIWMELGSDADETLMSLPKKVRRDIRLPFKRGFEVRQIRSEDLATQLQAMMSESFARTGAPAPQIPWEDWIRVSVRDPNLLRVTGLFEKADTSSRWPFAFAVAVRHGDVVEYAHAGSMHGPYPSIPLLYAPTWDLMRWATEVGARWWDFGGVSFGSRGDGGEDPRAGIDAFKLYFSKNVIEVGREWFLEPRPWLSRVSRSIRSVLGR